MTTETIIDPLAGLASDIPEATARDHAAALVLGNGTTLEAANAALSARGMVGLTANSREAAEAARAGLMNDDAFRAAYLAGNPDAVARLFQADLKVQQSRGHLTDKPAAPGDYILRVAPHMPEAPAEAVLNYGQELAKLSASLNLPPNIAQAMTDSHFDAAKREAVSSPEEREAYGNQQTADLHRVLGTDAEAKLKQASETLSKASGRNLDLWAICRSNSAEVALMLYHQAQELGRTAK